MQSTFPPSGSILLYGGPGLSQNVSAMAVQAGLSPSGFEPAPTAQVALDRVSAALGVDRPYAAIFLSAAAAESEPDFIPMLMARDPALPVIVYGVGPGDEAWLPTRPSPRQVLLYETCTLADGAQFIRLVIAASTGASPCWRRPTR